MRSRKTLFSIVFIFVILSLFLLVLTTFTPIKGLFGFLEGFFVPTQRFVFGVMQKTSHIGEDKTKESLQQENIHLTSQLVEQKLLQQEVQALKDQFVVSDPASSKLLPARIISLKTVLPNIGDIEELIIDRGQQHGVMKGQAIVYKNFLIGQVRDVSSQMAIVRLVTNQNFSLTGQTLSTGAIGVVKGQGKGKMQLENVVLSDRLQKGDIVLTKSDQTNSASLILGEIVSVQKQASALFQSADVESGVAVEKLAFVFVLL